MVTAFADGFEVRLQPAHARAAAGSAARFSFLGRGPWRLVCQPWPIWQLLLRRAANLSQALPKQAVRDYLAAVAQAVQELPAESRGTEVERLVRQRVGQERYRDALLAYWGGACAVTGVTVTEALRASHAKPGPNVPTMPSVWMPSTACCWWRISMRCSIVF